jgi:phospholipase/lecithinase/hemolysin
LQRLIQHGAKRIIVPGNLPTGCIPIILTLYASPSMADYDKHGCLTKFNGLALHHNDLLRTKVAELQKKHNRRHAKIVFADYYGPVLELLGKPAGTNGGGSALVACCGGGGRYNYNVTAACGLPGATACADPSGAVNWDGIHLTEAAYKDIAEAWRRGNVY